MSKKVKIIGAIVILLAFLFPLIYSLFFSKKTSSPRDNSAPQPRIESYDPPFTKEGELEILDGTSGDTIKSLSIEIADNEKEIMQGLMYRSAMLDSVGMLFIFDEPNLHTFWMKNTKIPLDIIFIDDQQRIVTIKRNTTPYSEKEVPSEKEVLYVLEVNAGFSDKYGVKVGDLIRFKRDSNPL
ncbi:MAG TPA: DUF192 domain-containing protein [Cytophagales bacterium]|nr:DUF192 domain-containing protein [Cytophagales bacterium]